MTLKYSFILEAVDRATSPVRKVRSATKGLGSSLRNAAREATGMYRAVKRGDRSLASLQRRNRRMRKLAVGTAMKAAGRSARKMARDIDRAVAKLKLLERAGRGAKRGLSWMGGKAAGLAKWGLAAGAAAGGFALFDMFRTAGQFEQYEVQLEGIEGSAKKAKQAIRWVQRFAEKTPFELDQVMEAFVALKAYGIDPANGSLLSLGDGAAGMSKPLMQAVEALADATTGEFERLKEFGIRAEKQGDRVTFKYRHNGKDIRREAAFTGSAIEEALKGIFSDRFGGGMVRQSKTMFGILSNIKDLWAKFMVMIADAGIFDKVKARLNGWRATIDKMAKDGRLAKWAAEISDLLEQAFDWGVKFAERTDWEAVGKGLGSAVNALVSILELLGKATAAFDRFQRRLQIQEYKNIENSWSPFVSDREKADARRKRRTLEQNRQGGDASASGLFNEANRVWRRQSSTSDTLKRINRSAQPERVAFNGRIRVDVDVRGPATARVRKLESSDRDVTLAANLGRSMSNAA